MHIQMHTSTSADAPPRKLARTCLGGSVSPKVAPCHWGMPAVAAEASAQRTINMQFRHEPCPVWAVLPDVQCGKRLWGPTKPYTKAMCNGCRWAP